MREAIGIVAAFLASFCIAWASRAGGYAAGYKAGEAAGYERGRIEADHWWLTAENGVDQARCKLWKEEEASE